MLQAKVNGRNYNSYFVIYISFLIKIIMLHIYLKCSSKE